MNEKKKWAKEETILRGSEKELEIQSKVLDSLVQPGAIINDAFWRTVATLGIWLLQYLGKTSECSKMP